MSAGYSKTPLAKKLGIKEGYSLLLHNVPKHYFMLFETLPEGLMELKQKREEPSDLIHAFYTEFADLKKTIRSLTKALRKNGMLWVSWPKGSSTIASDLKREMIRDHLLSLGPVDVKIAAIDEDWSGLKFVYRLKDR